MKNKIFLIIATFVGIIVLLLSFSSFLIQESTIKSLSADQLIKKRDERINFFNSYIKHRTKLLESLVQNKDFNKFLKTNKQQVIVENLFLTFAYSHKEVFQFRYINELGNEVIRIDNYDKPILVAENKLQNKKGRYYFDDTLSLNKDEIFYSKIDLNMEHGKIEKPIVPTLRIAMPVYSNHIKKGIIIININLTHFLKQLQDTSLYSINLVYDDGHIIINKNEQYNWSRDFKLPERIFDIYPMIPKQFSKHNDLTSEKYYMSKLSINTNNKIYMILFPKDFKKYEVLENQIKNIIYFLIAITLFGLPIGYFISLYIARFYEQKIELEELSNNHILVNSVINSTEDLIFYKDKNFKYIGCNNAFTKFVGTELNQIVGREDFELFDEEHASLFREMDKKMLKQNKVSMNHEWVDLGDKKVYFQTQKIPFNYDGTNDIGILGISRDITDLHLAQKKIKEQTYIDELTGAFNRKSYNEKIEEKLNLFKRYHTTFCILMFDIDDFKLVNDNYGHDMGDKVLIEFTNKVKQIIRKTDALFRIGGEEFIVILPKTELDNAFIVAEKIRVGIENLNIIESKKITISIGLTESQKEDSEDSMFKRVDNLLYYSKEHGKNMISKE